jgi:hypothetical protein
MDKDSFYKIIEPGYVSDEATSLSISQILEKYPYFAIAAMIRLKLLADTNNPSFAKELKRLAIQAPDSRKLFMLLEGEKHGIAPIEEEEEKVDSFALIDSFLLSNAATDGNIKEDVLLGQPSASSDYLYWSLHSEEHKNEKQNESEDEPRLVHQDLIDSFIEEDENRQGRGLNYSKEESQTTASPVEEKNVKPIEDTYFTETLAQIYVKQKRYSKALQIIRNLYLNYPEKNVYFADQIRFLEKLIINSKK